MVINYPTNHINLYDDLDGISEENKNATLSARVGITAFVASGIGYSGIGLTVVGVISKVKGSEEPIDGDLTDAITSIINVINAVKQNTPPKRARSKNYNLNLEFFFLFFFYFKAQKILLYPFLSAFNLLFNGSFVLAARYFKR